MATGSSRGRSFARIRALLFSVLLAACLVPGVRAQGTPAPFYLDVGPGYGHYGGERGWTTEGVLGEVWRNGGMAAGLGAGVVLGARWSAGVFYMPARLPSRLAPKGTPPDFQPIRAERSSAWTHLFGATARYRLFPDRQLSPYVHGGGTAGLSPINGALRAGIGPRTGLGLLLDVLPAASLYVEWSASYLAPDEALDAAAPAGDPDLLSTVSVGVRLRRIRTGASLRIQTLEAPARLKVDEDGLFSAQVAGAQDGAVYVWDFGDGTTASSTSVHHRYARPGRYTVRFTASDRTSRLTTSLETEVRLSTEVARIQSIVASPIWPKAGELVIFSPALEGTPPFTCQWDFGDGTGAHDCEARHRYLRPGRYELRFQAENAGGADSLRRVVVVEEDPCQRVPDLEPVYFDRNSREVRAYARDHLRENAAALATCPSKPIVVEGRAMPGEREPEKLADARARAVASFYTTLGIPPNRIVHATLVATEPPRAGEAVWLLRSVHTRLGDD